jgi:GT2 family glycosyltransferase
VLDPLSTTAPQTRHTVTALIVAHDGARLLPGLVKALAAQTYPVEQTVGVDTGSRDRGGAVLAELIGQDAVFGMNRSAGYGEAVAVALRHATRRRSGVTDPGLTRIEWIWLLHDDCEPAPDALEKLLRSASKDRSVVVVGPKVLDGQDRRTLCEVGVSIDRAGRRVTGIDPGEIDQGQHDHKRAVLAVSSAGMLVRRDVWDRLGGFDPNLKLFRDDIDFCWRVQAAGLRVQVATDAVLYHRELAARRRRPTEGGNARRLDRRNALYVLAVNLPLLTMLRVVGGCIVGSLIRAAYFLLTKQLDLSAAYAFSVLGLFAHPIRLVRGRRRRARGLAEGYTAVRLFIPPARTLSRLAEKIAGLISNGPPQVSYGRHQATSEESEEDEQFVDQQSVLRRVIGHPGVQLFVALLLVALIAERRLLGDNPLGGGALVPAWGGATALWREYLAGFHAVSVGSTASAPSYLAVVAALATVLGGQAWLAVDVLLLGCVPLAGLTGYLATRWLVTATPARMLLAASYALLPVATGAVAAGRLGTAVAFVLLPLIAVSAGRMLTAVPRRARRAAWATGLLIAVAAAFAPLIWVLGLVFAVAALAARRWLLAVDPVNAAIVVAAPFFVLFPWSLHLLTSPSAFLSEAGLSMPGLTTRGLSPTALLALSPGGPGLPPVWVTIGLGLALLSLVLPVGRARLVIAGWVVAVAGILTAVVVSRVSVTPPAGGQPASGWPGVALALAAIGLLLASAPAAQWLANVIQNGGGLLPSGPPAPGAGYPRSQRLLACAALVAAASAPLLVAVYWVNHGVRGPVGGITAPLLPAFVSASSTSGDQYRTLILRPDGAGLDYLVVRQGDPTLGEPELGVASAARAALSRQVAALGAPDGADAGDPGLVLGSFGIRWVLLPGPVDPLLAQRLDAALGLVAQNKGPSYDLWQVTGPVSRLRVVAADGTTTALSSGTVDTTGVTAPASGGTLVLAEPYGGWTATLNGQALKPVAAPVNGWAQGFVLPPGGGHLSITRDNLARMLSLVLELIATLAICLLALPGKRADPVEEAEALTALREARNGKRAASPARGPSRGVRTGVAGHRAGVGTDRFAFARKRPGQPRPDLEPADQELTSQELTAQEAADQVPAGQVSARHVSAGQSPPDPVPARQASAGRGRRAAQMRAGQASAGQVSAEQVRVGQAAAGQSQAGQVPADRAGSGQTAADETPAGAARDAEFTASAQSEALTKVGLSGWGQDSYGDRGKDDSRSGSTGAPWDMAGEWGSASGTGPSDAWSADPLGSATSPERAGHRDNPSRPTGQQPSLPRSPVPGSRAPQSPVLGTPVPEIRAPESRAPESRPPESRTQESRTQESRTQESRTQEFRAPEGRAPWDTGPRRAPWESGPQAPVTPTGPHPSSSARTGSQPAARTGTGPQPSSWADSQPTSRTGSQPIPQAGTGPQPSPWAGSQPSSRTGSQPIPGIGTSPQPSSWADPQPPARTGSPQSQWGDLPPSSWAESPPSAQTGSHQSPWGDEPPSAQTGSQQSPWGDEPPSAQTGSQQSPWGDEPPSSWADSQSPSRTGSQPIPRTGTGPQSSPWADPRPSSRTGAQPAARTGAQPAARTGAQPAARTDASPVSPAAEPSAPPTGTRPVSMAPWESGDWGKAPDWDAIGGHDVPPAPAASAPGTGSGPWPVTGRPEAPAKPEKADKPDKPERHSHRAAKHGRPSRWRGSGNRSTGDGES